MHYKRTKATSQHEMKRLDNKAYRAAEKLALQDETAVRPRLPRSARWERPDPLPLGDVPCNGNRHGKKKARPKKEKCPINGTHEWYHETISEKDEWVLPTGRWWTCFKCRPHGWNDHYCEEHRLVIPHTKTYKLSTCINCWTTKKTNPTFTDEKGQWISRWSRGYRYGRLVLKRRPQDIVAGMTKT